MTPLAVIGSVAFGREAGIGVGGVVGCRAAGKRTACRLDTIAMIYFLDYCPGSAPSEGELLAVVTTSIRWGWAVHSATAVMSVFAFVSLMMRRFNRAFAQVRPCRECGDRRPTHEGNECVP